MLFCKYFKSEEIKYNNDVGLDKYCYQTTGVIKLKFTKNWFCNHNSPFASNYSKYLLIKYQKEID